MEPFLFRIALKSRDMVYSMRIVLFLTLIQNLTLKDDEKSRFYEKEFKTTLYKLLIYKEL
jgi:hypothetical protein